MECNFSFFDSFSTIDYPGKVCCIVFFNGCNFRCPECHNKQTWEGNNYIDIDIIKKEILNSKPLIHTVIFSGGEPTAQIEPLFELCKFAKENGFTVGIETNGSNPWGMKKLKPYVDLFLIDVKAPIDNMEKYFEVTGQINASGRINLSLHSNIPIEIRIVDFNPDRTKEIIDSLPGNLKYKILSKNKQKP